VCAFENNIVGTFIKDHCHYFFSANSENISIKMDFSHLKKWLVVSFSEDRSISVLRLDISRKTGKLLLDSDKKDTCKVQFNNVWFLGKILDSFSKKSEAELFVKGKRLFFTF
jgi:hypothetical protein